MAHFLIADDEPNVRKSIRLRLEADDTENHTYEEAGDLLSILKAVKSSEESEDKEPFDLILLDHDLSGPTGLDVIEKITRLIGDSYCEHRIVVITGSHERQLASAYAEQGAIGHLNKPVDETQFWSTIDAALRRRELYVNKKLDWESALEVLDNLGILEGIESLKGVSQQYEALQEIHNNLLRDLQTAGQRDKQIAQAYQQASEALNQSPGSFESIYSFLREFGYTFRLVKDIEDIFATNRLQFIALQSYLKRISDNPKAYRIKHLIPGATGHYEYRVGRNFRLYFRYSGDNKIILERFGHKNVQAKIINFLDGSQDGDISQNESSVYVSAEVS